MRLALVSLVLLACSSSSPPEEPEPEYIGPCIADEERMLVLPGAGCFRVESDYVNFGRRGTHPCEADSCVIVDWDGTGDTGWSMFSGRSNPPAPVVTPAQCGTRC